MKKFNVYDVYMDDGVNAFRVTVPAPNKAEAKKFVEGNGEVVAIKDCDLQDIHIPTLTNTLNNAQWGQKEIDVITRCLMMCGLDR